MEPPDWYGKIELKLNTMERRRGFKDALFPLLGVLIGGALAFGGSLALANVQSAQEAAELLRHDRVEKYQAYSDAVNSYGVAAESRFDTCQPGTDLSLAEGVPCAPIQNVYQNARYNYVVAWRALNLVASERTRTIADVMTHLLPSTSVGFTGKPVDLSGDLDSDGSLGALLGMFNEIQRCDTTPVPIPECNAELDKIDDFLANVS